MIAIGSLFAAGAMAAAGSTAIGPSSAPGMGAVYVHSIDTFAKTVQETCLSSGEKPLMAHWKEQAKSVGFEPFPMIAPVQVPAAAPDTTIRLHRRSMSVSFSEDDRNHYCRLSGQLFGWPEAKSIIKQVSPLFRPIDVRYRTMEINRSGVQGPPISSALMDLGNQRSMIINTALQQAPSKKNRLVLPTVSSILFLVTIPKENRP